MKKYKLAVFIGRFQPFHNGHWYALNKCLEIAERVIIAIGSSNVEGTENNPWDYAIRKQMIEATLVGTDLLSGVSRKVEIVPVPDTESDSEWVITVGRIIKEAENRKQEIVFVSNNEWVTKLMAQAGYPVYETGLHNRDQLEGVKIRELIREGKNTWITRVPQPVAEIITRYGNL